MFKLGNEGYNGVIFKMNDLSKYHEVKHLIKSGACLQCRSNHLVGQIIMAASGPWSHSALVIEMAGRLWVVEAVPPIVHIVSLDVFLRDYPGEVWWFPLKDKYSSFAIKLIEYFAIEAAHQGVKYDFEGLFKQAFGNVLADGKEFFCSEFVQLTFHYAELIDTPLYGATPTDVAGYNIFDEPMMLVKQELPNPEGWPV